MVRDHPQVELLEGFLRKPELLENLSRAGIVRHLLTDCPVCKGRMAAAGWPIERRQILIDLHRAEADQESQPKTADDYENAFAAACASIDGFLSPEGPLSASADVLTTELLAAVSRESLDGLNVEPRFAHPAVVRELIEQSHSLRYNDPGQMLRLADLARHIADSCRLETAGGELRLADVRARGWMQYGNALRVCGRLRESENALDTARGLSTRGTRDPLLRARLLDHIASLRTSQSRLSDAREAADEAARIYRELGERHCLAQSMLLKATAAFYSGETENGIRILNRAIPLIDSNQHQELLLAACHNLIRGYIDLGELEHALCLYYEVRDLYRDLDAASTIRVRNLWHEGQILRDLGHFNAAESALLEARQGFLERGIAYEVAVVSLDLASVYVRAGKLDELQRTVSEALPIFRALGVGREAIAVLLQLQEAGGQERQALELIGVLSRKLTPLAR